ncbi:hypothetical protein GYMLUDRAFT_51605 [Collybiopsis luxurians FD-317 M1]|nr:hypothetical protein GYMLUDRAFT_51605 [Collybiopsis luxurians FD-317 M1]
MNSTSILVTTELYSSSTSVDSVSMSTPVLNCNTSASLQSAPYPDSDDVLNAVDPQLFVEAGIAIPPTHIIYKSQASESGTVEPTVTTLEHSSLIPAPSSTSVNLDAVAVAAISPAATSDGDNDPAGVPPVATSDNINDPLDIWTFLSGGIVSDEPAKDVFQQCPFVNLNGSYSAKCRLNSDTNTGKKKTKVFEAGSSGKAQAENAGLDSSITSKPCP